VCVVHKSLDHKQFVVAQIFAEYIICNWTGFFFGSTNLFVSIAQILLEQRLFVYSAQVFYWSSRFYFFL
jgi:hypothetical protein